MKKKKRYGIIKFCEFGVNIKMSEENLRQIIDLQDRLIELLGDQVCPHYESGEQYEIQFENSLWEQLSELKNKMNKNE